MDAPGHDAIAARLTLAGIEPTPLRLAVAETLARAGQALAAADILARVRRTQPVNKVTLYRILDLFVERGLAGRHNLGERAFRYCLGSRFSSQPHCHARCVRCGRTLCLPAGEGLVDLSALGASLPMDVTGVEVRIDGVCASCAAAGATTEPAATEPAAVDAGRTKT